MDALKANGFMVVVGVIVAAAAGLVGYRWFGIGGAIDKANGDLTNNRTQIEGIVNDPHSPNSSFPQVYKDQARNVTRELGEICKEYGASDDMLEKWADKDGKPTLDKVPAEGGWKAQYSVRGTEMKAELEKKGIKVGLESTRPVGPGPGPGRGAVKEEEGGLAFIDSNDMKLPLQVYQKQWWIQERFLKAVLDSSNVVRVEKVEFILDPGYPTDAASAAAAAEAAAKAASVVNYVPPFQRPFPIKVMFQLQIMYGDVAGFVTKLIVLDKDWQIRFGKVDLRVAKLAMFEGKPSDSDDIPEEVNKDGFDAAAWKPTKDAPVVPVRVTVTAEVLDFTIPPDKRK